MHCPIRNYEGVLELDVVLCSSSLFAKRGSKIKATTKCMLRSEYCT